MNELQIFNNPEFGEVRTMEEDGKVLFVANDVAKSLGYAVPKDAVSAHCKGAVKRRLLTSGGEQEMKVIPEGDVYRLVTHSKLPSAERFESWVFDEVLPAIRKHGAYMTKDTLEKALTSPDFGIRLLTELKAEREKNAAQAAEIEAARPKVIFADAVATSKTCILVGALAKLIKQNGIDIGQNRLFAWLRDNGYLIKSGENKNMPTQAAMDMKLFEVKESHFMDNNGTNKTTRTTKVTGKGQQYFINKFLAKKDAGTKEAQ